MKARLIYTKDVLSMIRKPSNKQIEYYFKWNLLSFEVVDYNC